MFMKWHLIHSVILFCYCFFIISSIFCCVFCALEVLIPSELYYAVFKYSLPGFVVCLFYGNNLRKLYISYSMFFSIYSILLEFYNYSQLQLFLTATNFVHFTCIQHSLLHNQKAYRHVKSTGVQSISLSKIIATGR